ncbi:MAG: DUF2231 domain-containing protein [Gemmatimonadota bacterium]
MRSAAHLQSHPIHPMLVGFPIAFFLGALLFDAAGVLLGRPPLWTTGGYLAALGVLSALAAAVPGVIDYVRTVPPKSSGKQRARRHGIVNVSATVLLAVSWLLRDGVATEPGLVVLALELGAVALLSMGGWMGGTLVYRNQIGVDHRYAGAGRWSELRTDAAGPVEAARADELAVDQMKLIVASEQRVVLARTEEGYVAFDDRCPHRGGSLAGGSMMCGRVQCPWHGSQFEVASGAVRAGPAEDAIPTYTVEERDGSVFVTL